MSRHRRIPWGSLFKHGTLTVSCACILLPLAWVLLLSVKSLPDGYRNHIWPERFDFSHYAYAFTHIGTLRLNMLNSLMVTAGSIVLTTITAVFAGYALVHLHTPGRAAVLGLLVASMFFPTRVTALIAIREIQKDLGLLNTAYGLILPYSAMSLAISVFIMRGIFQTVPRELADAASIDGCGPWKMLWRVMLPIASNGIVVVVILNFVAAWGEYLLAATLTDTQEVRTLPVVLATATGGQGQWAWPRIAAVYMMAIIPGLIAFAIAQRWYMQGLQEGALKS